MERDLFHMVLNLNCCILFLVKIVVQIFIRKKQFLSPSAKKMDSIGHRHKFRS